MKKLLVFVVFIFTLVFPTSVKASTVNYISPQPPTILSQNSTLYGVQVSVYIPVFSGYDPSYMQNVTAEMRSCLGCGVTSIGISPNLAHNGLLFTNLAYATQHTLLIRVFTSTEQLIVSKVEFKTISSLTTPTTTVASTATTTTVAPITTTTVTTNPPIASYSKPLSPPSMAPYSIISEFPVPSNQSLLQLSMQPGCCYSERIVCIDDKNKEHSWDSVNYPDNSKRYYDIVGVYDIYTTFSIKCLNSNSAGNSSWSPWYTYYGKTKPSVQTPVVQTPVVQAPSTPLKPKWKYVTKQVLQTVYSNVRTGAICRDGSSSGSTGRGTCSWHGGVNKWLTLPPKQTYVNKKYKCYLNQTTNQYTRNCVAV